VASFTGFPTVLGWPVHEWLWRGSSDKSIRPTTHVEKNNSIPDTVDKRREDVKKLYETPNQDEARGLIKKYGIDYVFLGGLEHEKYPNLNEAKFTQMNLKVVYNQEGVKIYKVQ
jgi:uncharacterized membrane protein